MADPSTEAAAAAPAADPTTEAAAAAPAAAAAIDAKTRKSLLRQLEYYFSDLSFPNDDFLLSKRDPDREMGVPVDVLASSPRIVTMTPNASPAERAAVLLEVAAESDDVRVVAGDCVARVWPLPAEDPKAPVSVYLSGVEKALDEAKLRAKLEGCTAAPKFGPIVSIRRLRDVQKDREHSGQVFVECESEAKALELLAAATQGRVGVPCNKARLLKDFFAKQQQTIDEHRTKREAKKAAAAAGGGGDGGGGSSSGGGGQKRGREEEGEEGGAAEEAADPARDAAERAVLLCVEGVGAAAERETFEKVLQPFGKVAFIDYQRGESRGTIRFETAEIAAAALEGLAAAAPDVGGAAPTWRQPSEEESKAYWKAYRERKRQQKANSHGYKRGKGGGGGKGGGRGRGGGWRGGGRR